MEEDSNENGDYYNSNEDFESDNSDNINRIKNDNINKRGKYNINNRMINENVNQIRKNIQDNQFFNFGRNVNQIQESNINNFRYQPQNPEFFHLNIVPEFNPIYNQNSVPYFNPINNLGPNINSVGIQPEYLDNKHFQNNLILGPNFNNQIPDPFQLIQSQIQPIIAPCFVPISPLNNIIQIKNIEINDAIWENNVININDALLNQIISLENFNIKMIYFPTYKSDLSFYILNLPDIRKKLSNKIKNNNYFLNKEEEKIIFKNNYILINDSLFINEYMFYISNRISLYAPHIIRGRNDIISILLSKDLILYDFQYAVYYNKMNIFNDIFLKTLIKRIKEYNHLKKKNGVICDNKYNERIFGFNFNVNNNYYYLYSTIDDDIISNKLKENYLIKNKKDLNKNKSQNDKDDNMDYFEELTFEELIIYKILERLENKYELLPRIIYYEYYLTINDDRAIFSNSDLQGYSDIDYVIYSKCDCIYNKDEI